MLVRHLWLTGLATVGGLACTPQAFFNNTASLGGTDPGSRGRVGVIFDNQTDYRAIFTYGIFDQQDKDSVPLTHPSLGGTAQPNFGQFAAGTDAAQRLEGHTQSSTITLECGRTLAIGTSRLIEVMRGNKLTADLDQSALEAGIGFSDKPLDDPDAGNASKGRIDGTDILQGYEFQCEALIIVRFVQVSADPFEARIEWDVVLQ